MESRRVVVTGMGALTAIGNSLQDYWRGLMAGRSGAAPITRFDASLFKTRFACEIKDFDSDAYFGPKDARKMDAYTQYALVVADEAVRDAGLELDQLDRIAPE
jgi:3-oxoacyl-[acyl-carrier-protein] synthase II